MCILKNLIDMFNFPLLHVVSPKAKWACPRMCTNWRLNGPISEWECAHMW